MNQVTPEKVAELDRLFRTKSPVCIVTHAHPDGDAMGSSIALADFLRTHYGQPATILIPDAAPAELAFLTGGETILDASLHDEASALPGQAGLILCTDFNRFNRTGVLEAAIAAASCPKVLIDHHLDPDPAPFDLVFSRNDVSSASELVYDILLAMPQTQGQAARLPRKCAAALMTGMTTDTNNFANSVYPGTLRMAAELLAAGVDRDSIVRHLYFEYRENRVRAISRLLQDHLDISENGIALIIVTRAFMDAMDLREGELEGLVNIPLSIASVRMSLLLREEEDFFRVSIRSKEGCSANRLAVNKFHGGGHELAAGGRLYVPGDIPDKSGAAGYVRKVTADL
ncbi:MAG: DHH family phosphoesterase [Bacteroidales bacterium]|nr:DHH family phosphoesterase [Bacteroidales bacterium]